MKKSKIMIIGLVILGMVLVLLLVIALQPSAFTITRSATFSAPAEKVFEQVNDYHKWEAWSPWIKIDPNCKNSYAGAATGVGSKFSWDGNDKVGAGRMEITESKAGEFVKMDLDFERPMKAHNITEFSFKAQGGQTLVTWTMSGNNNFMGKAFGLFVNLDKMVGGDFEKGLASMKLIVEGAAAGKS